MSIQERLIGAGVFGTAAGGMACIATMKSYGEVPGIAVGVAVLFTTMALVEGGYKLIDGYLCNRRVSKHNKELKTAYPEYVK